MTVATCRVCGKRASRGCYSVGRGPAPDHLNQVVLLCDEHGQSLVTRGKARKLSWRPKCLKETPK